MNQPAQKMSLNTELESPAWRFKTQESQVALDFSQAQPRLEAVPTQSPAVPKIELSLEEKQREAFYEIGSLSMLSPQEGMRQLGHLQARHPELFSHISLEELRKLKLSDELNERDKFSFLSAAMCSPLFLLGMGAALAVLDEFKPDKNNTDDKLKKLGVAAVADNVARAKKAATAEEAKLKENDTRQIKPLSPEGQKLLGLISSKQNEGQYLRYGIQNSKKPSEISEKVKHKLYQNADNSWEGRAAQKSIKTWMKKESLLKQRLALGEHLEKVRGRIDYASFARLVSQAESMDKQLKRMDA